MKVRSIVRAGAVLFGAVGLTLIPLAGSAAADISGGCEASAVIDGVTYTPGNDTEDDPVVIPDKDGLTATWKASTTGPITDHMGKIYVVVGPSKIEIDSWGDPNKPRPKLRSGGDYDIDGARDDAFEVVGLYRVEGYHRGKGGECKGFVMVKIEGSPLGTLPGAASAGGTILAGAGLAAAAMAKKGGTP